MKKILGAIIAINFLFGFDCDLENLVGYQIIAKKKVYGDFKGCDYDKKIVFMDRTYVVCDQYGYTYSYMPTAIILSDGYVFKMCVNDRLYRIKLR